MIEYEPNARYMEHGEEQKLFTYDSAFTMEQAVNAIRVWKTAYHYPMHKAWVDVRDGGKIIKTVDIKLEDI